MGSQYREKPHCKLAHLLPGEPPFPPGGTKRVHPFLFVLFAEVHLILAFPAAQGNPLVGLVSTLTLNCHVNLSTTIPLSGFLLPHTTISAISLPLQIKSWAIPGAANSSALTNSGRQLPGRHGGKLWARGTGISSLWPDKTHIEARSFPGLPVCNPGLRDF